MVQLKAPGRCGFTARALLTLGRLMPDFGGLPRPFWVLFGGTLVNRVGGFVIVFLAIYLTEVRGLNAAQAGAVISPYCRVAFAVGGSVTRERRSED